MQHTLIAVFDNRSDAQKAMDDLLASGFARSDLRLSEGDAQAGAGASGALHEDESMGESIKHFFSDLFGSDRGDRMETYNEAISRGHYVLSVTAPNEPEVERAADLVERYGPVDIDEKSSAWSAGSTAGGGAVARQQSAHLSQQSGAGSAQASRSGSMQYANTESQSIPVVQEELKVGKREVQRGGVRIYSHVVETPVDESVNLREEHVTVQRRAIDKMVDPADVPAFQEKSFEMRETAEEAVVEKSARLVEEVVIGKEVTSREEHITDTLRRTEVEVEQLSGADDDESYRSHWSSTYAGTGRSYDELAPAYQYGSEMRRSELYRGRPFEDVETDLRSDWARTHPSSAWENFKAAVKHGWDRMTS
ncbi:YsnF/AvaK domain-containing protein [Massilia soli]|uniref:YsnF/AvaK domain-containing protein n=1 Tax=Massilia soli TaxID=2792854 RepID=A0ABS7SUS9_9BURK|nr:YsnF/AvaK domain-containing protein [Massilia soli]MBZ2209697.1 YsnF/AvaK domain-containing protein [Massilia soli]